MFGLKADLVSSLGIRIRIEKSVRFNPTEPRIRVGKEFFELNALHQKHMHTNMIYRFTWSKQITHISSSSWSLLLLLNFFAATMSFILFWRLLVSSGTAGMEEASISVHPKNVQRGREPQGSVCTEHSINIFHSELNTPWSLHRAHFTHTGIIKLRKVLGLKELCTIVYF